MPNNKEKMEKINTILKLEIKKPTKTAHADEKPIKAYSSNFLCFIPSVSIGVLPIFFGISAYIHFVCPFLNLWAAISFFDKGKTDGFNTLVQIANPLQGSKNKVIRKANWIERFMIN